MLRRSLDRLPFLWVLCPLYWKNWPWSNRFRLPKVLEKLTSLLRKRRPIIIVGRCLTPMEITPLGPLGTIEVAPLETLRWNWKFVPRWIAFGGWPFGRTRISRVTWPLLSWGRLGPRQTKRFSPLRRLTRRTTLRRRSRCFLLPPERVKLVPFRR